VISSSVFQSDLHKPEKIIAVVKFLKTENQVAMASGRESEGPGFKPLQLQATFDSWLQKKI